MKSIFILFVPFLLLACGGDDASTINDVPIDSLAVQDSTVANDVNAEAPKKRTFPSALDNGKFFDKEGKHYLYGGEEDYMHFDITACDLVDSQFHYGIGREAFPALLQPEFTSIAEVDTAYPDSARFLLLQKGTTTKAYSIHDLTRHEVVNDVVEGEPIMAAYCILADLGAIYTRTIGDREFTFALSGYIYADPQVWDGMNGFVLWDRETESLWWPLTGNAVSGAMRGTKMQVLQEEFWSQTTWGNIVANHPDAKILISGQDFDRPTQWQRYDDIQPVTVEGTSIAPRWGENDNLQED